MIICPVHKGGSRAVPKNYRPVALTSHLIKVFERVLRRELVRHIERLGLLPDGQHGSRAMRSTLTQLLSHFDSILDGLEKGEGVDAVYLDFQTRGKPADPQIYLEATYLQDPGLEAHLVKLDYLISYLDRGSNITRLSCLSAAA